MLRPILNLQFPESVRLKLQSMGYEYIEDIEEALLNFEETPTQLQAIIHENNISERVVSANKTSEIISAASLWHSEFCNPPIAVFHEGLDKLLDGGLPVGRITELCGAPGCGKTQMCLQFCVDVQMPSTLGGSAAEALYVSTDFGFSVSRLKEMIQASIDHFSTVEIPNKETVLKNFTTDHLLNGVNVLSTYEASNFFQAIKNLNDFFQTNQKIKLLIIDSFSLPLVVEVEDLMLRSKIISEMLDILLEYAMTYKLAVVLTNQLTTVLTKDKAVLQPSLGEGFGHRLHQRLLLDDGKIYLTKSINRPQLFTRFEITKNGIR